MYSAAPTERERIVICYQIFDKHNLAQSVGAVEYTDCILVDECPGYHCKQTDEAPILLEL